MSAYTMRLPHWPTSKHETHFLRDIWPHMRCSVVLARELIPLGAASVLASFTLSLLGLGSRAGRDVTCSSMI